MAEMTLDKAEQRPLSQQADAFLKQWREVRDEWPSGASSAHAWGRQRKRKTPNIFFTVCFVCARLGVAAVARPEEA